MRQATVQISRGRIAAIARQAPKKSRRILLKDCALAAGFIDLHAWGKPTEISRDAVRFGTTAYLTTLGPQPKAQLLRSVAEQGRLCGFEGASCLGIHLEGPFLNPVRKGVLQARWMRLPGKKALEQFLEKGPIRMVTLAPELPGAIEAVSWCRKRGIVASMGHSDADAKTAKRALQAGAMAVTHVFNGMRPFHHRVASLLDVALTEPRLVTMVIADGIHASAEALRLLVRSKGPSRIALVTDSVRSQRQSWGLKRRGGAFYAADGTLAGSALTMVQAVRNMVHFGAASLADAVRMAGEVPARLLGLKDRGRIVPGARADLVAFDSDFRVRMTLVAGHIVYQRR
ncbi:MAG: N-acetylglucosamine-6-phosphate deacetylase [Candidatus Omnitrophica bacterium]|nr:N-acetylglucosamine-6-phosphate deacetylase [Candidatus Omnitrophota bacterium]